MDGEKMMINVFFPVTDKSDENVKEALASSAEDRESAGTFLKSGMGSHRMLDMFVVKC